MRFTKKKFMSSLIAASILFSSLPSLVLAEDNADEVTPTTSVETTVVESTSETTTAETTTETTVDENVTSIPTDETEPTTETVEDIEEPPIDSTESSSETVTETTNETTVETSETTAETSETTTETTTSESVIVTAKDSDEFYALLKNFPDANRLIVDTTKDLDMITFVKAIYFDGTYFVTFSTQSDRDVAANILDENNISYAVDGELSACGNDDEDDYTDYNPNDGEQFDWSTYDEDDEWYWEDLGEEIPDEDGDEFYKDKSINPNAKTKIAIIDTGSNKANEAYSVIGTSVADDNGHGTEMANIILNQTDDAYIISIKALNADGKGQMSDIYAAVQLAESMNVDYILMAISIRDNGKYDAFKELITNTKAKVVASAGNNGTDASKYLPASIDKVYTAAATDEDDVIMPFSNYGTCVDYYVDGDSTSESAAIVAGLLIAGEYINTYGIVDEHYYEEGSEYEFDTDSVSIKYGSTKYYYAISSASIQSSVSTRTTAQFYSRVLNYGATKVKNKTKYSGGCIDFAIRSWQYGRSSSGSNFTNTIASHKFVFDETTGCTTFMKTKAGIKPNASCGIAGFTYKTTNTSDAKTCGKAFYKYITTYGTKGDMILGSNNKDTWVHAMIYAGTGKESFGGKKVNAIKVYEVPGKGKAARSRLISAADFHTSMTAKSMTRVVLLKAQQTPNMSGIKLTKAVSTDYNNLITNNSCYSLTGTTYGLFSDAACTEENMLAEFTMDASGACSTLFTPTVSSTYYLKELEPGSGFKLDSTIYRIYINSNTRITIYNDDNGTNRTVDASNGVFNVTLTDNPVADPFRIALRKVDNFGKPVNGATMNGATFIIEYYAQDLGDPHATTTGDSDDVDGDDDDGTATGDGEGDGEDLGDAGGTDDDSGEQDFSDDITTDPTVVYRITINGTGAHTIKLSDVQALTPIGGTNPNYLKNLGNSTNGEFPLGTIRIYEETAPSGYSKNEQVIRIRIYQDDPDNPDSTDEQYIVETETGNSRFWNHTLDGSDMNLVLAEAPEVGYYELTKKIPVGEYDVSGFEFELWNKTQNILIATGISQTNGKVLWTYVIDNYKSNSNPNTLLTGTTTEKLELALGPSDARIEYEVIEKERTDVKYKAVVPVQFITPTVSGKSVTLDQGYYSIVETFTENGQTISREINNTPKAIAALKIRKSDTSNDGIARTFTFDIYYLGNGTTASTTINEYVESVSVTTNTAGEGTATIEGLPTGWYKVVEKTNDLKITYPNGQIVDATGYNDTITFDVVNSSTPKIGTTLVDSQTSDHIGVNSTNTKLVDTVSYEGLFSGTYKVSGVLMDKKTNQPFKINGQPITGTAQFTLEKKVNAYGIEVQQSGTVPVEFTFDSTGLKGISLVAFEELYLGNELIAEHKDINEEGQTVSFPDINTVLVQTDKKDVLEYKPGETVSLTDTVYYRNLVPNKQYTIKGVLVSKTENGVETTYTGTKTFTATTSEGTETVTFNVPYNDITGKILVAYEGLSFNGVTILEDNDINNEAETVYVPEIKTTLKDNATGDQISSSVENITLTDTVKYTSLKPGVKYLMTGTLVNKETGEAIKDSNGNPIYGSTEFTPETSDGTVDVVFTFKNVVLPNTTIVAFERLEYEGIDVAIHADIDDYPQTTFIPDIHTTFYDVALGEKAVGDGASLASYGKTVKLVDKVYYENVVPGKEYSVTGTVMVKSTKEALKDAEGKPYTVTKTFTPTDKTGYVEVEFEIDTTVIPNTSLVCYETLSFNSVKLVIHNNIDDVDQTVNVPSVQTTATDKADGDKTVDGTKTEQTIVDTVKYTNLIVGKKYTITGKLVVKKDYADGEEPEVVKGLDGNDLIVSKTFTAEKADGTETLEFTFDASKYSGYQVVVFEDLYYNDIKIGTHSDLTDENQTIEISLLLHIKIAKMDGKNIKYVLRNAEITIYRATLDANGELVKDADGNVIYEVVKDKTGNDCIGMTDTDGFVDFTITWDRHFKYFAKETKAPRGYNINDNYFEVVPTENREDLGICLIPIQIVDFAIPPRTGDTTPVGLLAGISLIAVAVVIAGAVFLINKKKAIKTDNNTTITETTDTEK